MLYKVLKNIKWIAAALLLLVSLLTLWNTPRFRLFLYNKLNNHYSIGDKLYAKQWLVDDTASYNLNLYRRIRPMNEDEVDEMDIPLWQKAHIKKELKPSDKTLMLETDWAISSDSLCKLKTACIGTFIDYQAQYVKLSRDYVLLPFFSIHPNKKALIKEDDLGLHKIPDGYVFDDGPFYIRILDVSNKEINNFRLIK